MEMLFNNSGVPLVGYGRSAFYTTTGAPRAAAKTITEASAPSEEVKLKVAIPQNDDPNTTSVKEITIVDWGTGNKFPDDAIGIIGKVGVLNTGLRFVRNFTLGQGIFPAKITGYDKYGNETLELVDNPDVVTTCNSRVVRRYMENAGRDYFKFGPSFVELIMNADGTQIAGINAINARYCRLSKATDTGEIEYCIVSGRWPDAPSEGQYEVIEVLDEYDPLADLNRRRIAERTAGKKFVFVIRDSWSNNGYYSEPLWYSAYLAGWTELAGVIPSFLKKAYANQITWRWHVQIPYSFFEKKFPAGDYETTTDRQNAVETFIDEFETNLCGPENAEKPIFTFFAMNEMTGKAEEQWIITKLENKISDADKLVTSAAANSEIMFALMVNPNVMGAGMPGGTYAGNQGGSNIREAYLVNIANAWLDRQNLLDPLECMLAYNGITDVQIRFRNTILVTLDSGKGTVNNLS